MLRYAAILLFIAIAAAVLGLSGICSETAAFAKVLVALVLLLLLLGLMLSGKSYDHNI